MKESQLILLGRIIKPYGHQGDVVIALEPGLGERIKEPEQVYIMTEGIPVPFFISGYRKSGDTIIARFEWYESIEKIREFTGCEILIDISEAASTDPSGIPLTPGGYLLTDSEGKELGKIVKIESYPMQLMLVVESINNEEILVPFSEELVLEIDHERGIVVMDLPEGINDIN